MRYYKKLPENYLWTISDSCDDTDGMTISDNERTFYLKKIQYPKSVYDDIINQANAYKIVKRSVLKTSEATENFYHEQKPETDCLVVKDNCFVGIFTKCTFELEAYLHSSQYEKYLGILFTDGDSVGINYDELHRRPGCWEFTGVYSLEKC